MRRFIYLIFALLTSSLSILAQTDTTIYAKYTTNTNRIKLLDLVSKSIHSISNPLTDSTEDSWQDAFGSMELIYHTSPWEQSRLQYAFDSFFYRTPGFQRSLLELIYANYPTQFIKEASGVLHKTTNEKIFAMCAEYLLRNNNNVKSRTTLLTLLRSQFTNLDHPILRSLEWRLKYFHTSNKNKLALLFNKDFLPGNVVMFSFQRKNRDYPGIVIVRDGNGNFMKDGNGNIFSVPQLARSLSNLPGYLTDGSTPQGIFRMDGFDISHSTFIGPTKNIQLTMPGETSVKHFMKDTTILDSIWTETLYSKLLPPLLRSYFPIYGSYFAGMAGRTEIISHGTTVDPEYYHTQKFFPFTPTEGCLCTKEFWNPIDGKRMMSDQQKLVNTITKAGGPDGYCIVLELDDKQQPVTLHDVHAFPSIK